MNVAHTSFGMFEAKGNVDEGGSTQWKLMSAICSYILHTHCLSGNTGSSISWKVQVGGHVGDHQDLDSTTRMPMARTTHTHTHIPLHTHVHRGTQLAPQHSNICTILRQLSRSFPSLGFLICPSRWLSLGLTSQTTKCGAWRSVSFCWSKAID